MSQNASQDSIAVTTYKVPVWTPLEGRQEFYAWLWQEFLNEGLLGIHEGSVLTDEAVEKGIQTESWIVDSAEAPADRDWVGHLSEGKSELFFASYEQAVRAISVIEENLPLLFQNGEEGAVKFGTIQKQEPEDWDAQWKASFAGARIEPFWRIAPAWEEASASSAGEVKKEKVIRINPGAGFGTGTHETTQLCLSLIGEVSQAPGFLPPKALDFGSGSGILAIGLALLGAEVDAVEVDAMAVENAKENAELNALSAGRIHFAKQLSEEKHCYSLVVANILRPVLIEFAPALVERMAPQARLILSGLIGADVPQVVQVYSQLLGISPSRICEKGEWRAILF